MIDEFETILKEAYASVQDVFSAEDKGWINLSVSSVAGQNVLSADQRKVSVQKARYYATIDPLAKQAVRLWTDYTFGPGMNWSSEDEAVSNALSAYWDAPQNKNILSARGQRVSSDKLIIDGEIFFALFLGPQGQATIRRIDPLEITDIVADPDDQEDVRYYRRDWSTTNAQSKTAYYRSHRNLKDESCVDALGATIRSTNEAIVYHLPINTIGQRGNSMLLPAGDWIKLYRQFLASRVAIMLALAKFAWRTKRMGGAASVATAKAQVNGAKVDPGSWLVENAGSETQPIKTDSGAQNAYQDGRQIKLQVSAATGWPEQYFGDISIGNLATAKTVELPVMKMCQSYQAIWKDAYDEIDNLVLDHAGVSTENRHIDRDFPPITPADESAMATNIGVIGAVFPEFLSNRDVAQQALMSIGIQDTNEVLDEIFGTGNKESNVVALTRALRQFREVLQGELPTSRPNTNK